jgi:hypothetical protein
MGHIEVEATRTAISTARAYGRLCSSDEDDAQAAVLLAGSDEDIAGVSDARDEAAAVWLGGGAGGWRWDAGEGPSIENS